MDENTIAEMRARATAAKERIDAVEDTEVDEPEFDEVVAAAAMFANDAAKLAEDVDALTKEVERLGRRLGEAGEQYGIARFEENKLRAAVAALTQERDAYKKAKVENDERFMLERDEARNERDAARDECFGLFATVNTLNRNAAESLAKLDSLTQERNILNAKLTSLEPLLEALICADRQELPRDLADCVTAYVAALPTPAVAS